jgi:hypothetical protein
MPATEGSPLPDVRRAVQGDVLSGGGADRRGSMRPGVAAAGGLHQGWHLCGVVSPGWCRRPRSDGASLTYAAWCRWGENLDRFVWSAMVTSLMLFLF